MISNKTGCFVMFWFPDLEQDQPKFIEPDSDIPFQDAKGKVKFFLQFYCKNFLQFSFFFSRE
jgi:hypothetical protein